MTIHKLKTWPEYFAAVQRGDKTFEARKDDREFKVGDILQLQEWCPKARLYMGHEIAVRVTYCLRDPQFVKEGHVIMGIKPL